MRWFGKSRSRSKFRGNGKTQCFYYKEYDLIERDYLKCANEKKGDILVQR